MGGRVVAVPSNPGTHRGHEGAACATLGGRFGSGSRVLRWAIPESRQLA